MIAVAYLCYQAAHRPHGEGIVEGRDAGSCVSCFGRPINFGRICAQATLFNDIAIALFVLDVFLVMVAGRRRRRTSRLPRPMLSRRAESDTEACERGSRSERAVRGRAPVAQGSSGVRMADRTAVIFLDKYPSLWYASAKGTGVFRLRFALITSGFLFSGLQNCSRGEFFQEIFANVILPRDRFGCYIDFRGYSRSCPALSLPQRSDYEHNLCDRQDHSTARHS